MARRQASWASLFARSASSMAQALKPLRERSRPPAGDGAWLRGWVSGPGGIRRYWLYRPPGVKFGERLPLMVMLHGCHQDAKAFAGSTRMNAVAARERFLVLYPEQDRISNSQGCWNWFDLKTGRAQGEAASIMAAIDQVCVLYAADRERIAVAGLSAGASMAALLATRYPSRIKAVVMHSGIPPGTASSSLSAVGAMQGLRSPHPLRVLGADTHWPPLLVIHGQTDGVVAVSNASAATQLWSDAANAKAGASRGQQRGKRYPMTVTEFKRAQRRVATLVRVEKLGHAWSGGAAGEQFSDANGPDASRMAWRFAAREFAAVA